VTRARRIVLAAVVALDVTVLAVVAHGSAAEATGERPWLRLLASVPSVGVIAAIGLVGAMFFARGRRPLAAGLLALAALTALESLAAAFSGSHQRVVFASGATLAGWLVGLAFARRAGEGPDESLAETGGVAALAATYVDAGLSKLIDGGLHWADATSVQVAILVHHPVDDPSPLAHYARFLVQHPGAAQALSIATLAFELGAVALVLGPRIRKLWAVLLVSFHVNVALVTHDIFYVQTCVLLLAFSFLPARAMPPVSPERTRDATRAVGRWIVVAVAGAWLVRTLGAMGR
jgi:hypothetical protein